ncbi:4-diphosphocytidyl-2-C-methyl-D-erythritol kinase [Sphingomonas jinjuensis]|uniref:4-diphosphocytidyl-2-C-methyl-D-erythritol kinase n=1 Tax=Sphingomonas jinjuensis TaxID=535907 RepID=A0A840FJX6_9SPHN|nr:4-(cytidine 5'-diphospho)-2-C-methyl-D-erythritol kinase [Sphingomonas jinjuensis]MBB4154258.1 4-diphosphocytidyl-2-C-methyl-D-erythritol kinase [Sphingomonas jinjuensis]
MIAEAAPAKINLALHVRRRRADGYHDLETLFAFARDGDVVTVAEAEWDRFEVVGPFAAALGHPHPSAAVPLPPSPGGRGNQGWADNLVTRAVDAFRERFGVAAHYAITLDKRLPIASGIGGGSADAAATLRALATLHGLAPDAPALMDIASSLGADVPACLVGRTTLGEGRGDALRLLDDSLARTPLLLVNPGVAVSTAAVFGGWDGIDRGPLAEGALIDRALASRNDLEPPARQLAPAIDAVLALLAGAPGVMLSRMSGSGATCFALFASEAERDAAGQAASAKGWWTLATTLA